MKDKVLTDRYLQEGETEDDMYRRVAKAIANGDSDLEPQFYCMMRDGLFLPNTPTLVNAGTDNGGLSACYVVPVEDSLDSIYKALVAQGHIHKSFGGTGFDFSKLRPKGTPIGSTGGKATGPIGFMKLFNANADAVRQGGKREGANMGILRVDHPDIEEFVCCKEVEGELSHFNISVAVTDIFMKAACVAGDQFELTSPINPDTYETCVNARELLNNICEHIWKNGEPGIVFIDEVNKYNQTPSLGDITATNPCITGDSLVPTLYGIKRMDNICIGDKVYVGDDKFETIQRVWDVSKQAVYKVITSRGYALSATPDHKFVTTRGLIPLSELTLDDVIEVQTDGYLPIGTDDNDATLGLLAGWIYGDGWVSGTTFGMTFSQNDREEAEMVLQMLKDQFGIRSTIRDYTGKPYVRSANPALRIHSGKRNIVKFANQCKDLSILYNKSRGFIISFISGWLAADGHIERSNSMSINLSCKDRYPLEVFATLLLQFGIQISNIYSISRKEHHKDAHYGIKPGGYSHYRLSVTGEDKHKLLELITLYGSMNRNLDCKTTSHSSKSHQWQSIVSIDRVDDDVVYDFETDGNKLFFANGIRTLDCGEQPLLPWESCNLGSINLAKFVGTSNDSLHTGTPIILWDTLSNTVKLAVQFLNNVIDVNNYPLEEIKDASLKTRKIGLGVMGWHDMLVKMGLPYNSDEALQLADQVMMYINDIACDVSNRLAKEDHSFPSWMNSIWDDKHIGMANATLTTIAPTGSLSIIAECSSGVEPVFAWKHIRKIESGEFEVKHPTYDEAIAWDDDAMMDTAGDISPSAHIRMQAAFQKHVHNAVSKTINLPNDATVEDIKDAIMLAWKLKCKGITMYRDGSRNEQVLSHVSESESSPDIEQSTSHRIKHTRPKVLTGTTEKLVSGCGEMFVTVNMLDGVPYEVIIPRGSGGCQANMEAIGRLISLGLRSDISIDDIVKQLNKVQCSNAIRSKKSEGDSCAQIIGGQLTKMTNNITSTGPQHNEEVTEQLTVKHTCPECNGILSFGEGCMNGSCPNCGWSGCS